MTETHDVQEKSRLKDSIENNCWVVLRMCSCSQRVSDFFVRITDTGWKLLESQDQNLLWPRRHLLLPDTELLPRWCFEAVVKHSANPSKALVATEVYGEYAPRMPAVQVLQLSLLMCITL